MTRGHYFAQLYVPKQIYKLILSNDQKEDGIWVVSQDYNPKNP